MKKQIEIMPGFIGVYTNIPAPAPVYINIDMIACFGGNNPTNNPDEECNIQLKNSLDGNRTFTVIHSINDVKTAISEAKYLNQ